MSNTRLNDLRSGIENLAEADQVFADLARLEIQITAEKAKAEAKIATIKTNTDARIAPLQEKLAGLRQRLSVFIDSRRDQFAKPKTRATDWGYYGLRNVTDVVISDPQALLDRLMTDGLDDCIKIVRSPIKPAIKARLKNGEKYPGCYLREGETVVCKVSKSLLDEAATPED